MSQPSAERNLVEPSVSPDVAPPPPPAFASPAPRALVKSEDWVAAWLGLAVIALVLAGVRPELPTTIRGRLYRIAGIAARGCAILDHTPRL